MRRVPMLIVSCLLVLALALTSCGFLPKKVPLSAERAPYAGTWVAADGTCIVLYLDGSGDLKTANMSVTGGAAVFAEGTLSIGIGPIKKTMKITQPPAQGENGWTIGLDGFTYVKSPQ